MLERLISDVTKENKKWLLLTLISLKNKKGIIKYAESIEDPDIKECADKLIMLNENTIKSFWNLSPEQENRMMQNTREYLIRKKGIKKEEITIARNMIKKI